MIPDAPRGIGPGWIALVIELQQQIRRGDSSARVKPSVTAGGLLAVEVQTTPGLRAGARALARHYEARAVRTCERCGGQARIVTAGSVVAVLCADCTEA